MFDAYYTDSVTSPHPNVHQATDLTQQVAAQHHGPDLCLAWTPRQANVGRDQDFRGGELDAVPARYLPAGSRSL